MFKCSTGNCVCSPLELCRTGGVRRNTKFIGRSDQLMGEISARNLAAAASGSLGGPAVGVGESGWLEELMFWQLWNMGSLKDNQM